MFDLLPHRRRYGKEMVSFKDEVDNLFKRFFDTDFPVSRRLFGDRKWAPRVDVAEGKGEITVKAEIPGCEVEDIDVKLDGRTLTIRGEKKQEKEEKDDDVHRVERAYGSFLPHDGTTRRRRSGRHRCDLQKRRVETGAEKDP